MSSQSGSQVEVHRDEFLKLVETNDEDKCIEYINKYNDFYDAIYSLDTYGGVVKRNILMYICINKLSRVAKALIDKKCDLTFQDEYEYTALMYASSYGLYDVVAYIIDNSLDMTTRCNHKLKLSEMMFLCYKRDNNANIVKMIDKGYDIYYKNDGDESLFTEAINNGRNQVVKKLIDIDTDFINGFNTYYNKRIKNAFYDDIMKYCAAKRDTIKCEIITTMNEASPTNALYQSFHTTYAVGLVDVICDFILLKV
ncbi:MAG: hypothetical protein Faunusvirus42_5 [Faunusvirus sp.]|jgi:ankyrin repeat protein|uniref:Uncharacterized protein n=1 Tax=Faunusvirus sp. TaxID=2487766 RepID=A0A3G4ZXY3_9VIRU|nr:MAG: hypothetical protein Faunusvirus42_5 [Faunusvirus sp.]